MVYTESREDRINRARTLASNTLIPSKDKGSSKSVEEEKTKLNNTPMICACCKRQMRQVYIPEHILSHNLCLEEYLSTFYKPRAEFVELLKSIHGEDHLKSPIDSTETIVQVASEVVSQS